MTGSRTADMRSAIVDYFREQGHIMIATEAGAEGINLQFCSLVVNYDLPWNPQRIEQRIGRCHRYGQKHDVVVVNFLNQKNEADQRVFKLLSEKFSLFEGVFGVSDEVLGAIESGVDFEKRIAEIYHRCRTPGEIQVSFDHLQEELSAQIDEAMTRTRQQLLENFDEEVHEKLRINLRDSQAYLNRYERWLMDVTRHELGDHAEFIDGQSAFRLISQPYPNTGEGIPLGLYELPRRTGEAHLYRLGHPLAERVLGQAKAHALVPAVVTFDYSSRDAQISALEPFVGQHGELLIGLVTVESLDQAEDHVLVSAVADGGQILEEGVAVRLFSLPAKVEPLPAGWTVGAEIEEVIDRRKVDIQKLISDRNAGFFEAEAERLEGWADDRKLALERELKDLDRQIKEARRAASGAPTLDEKLAGQKQIRALESLRTQKRRALFDAQDEIDARRNLLIAEIEKKLEQKTSFSKILSIQWKLV